LNNLSHIIKSCTEGDDKAQRSLYDIYKTKWYMTSLRYGKNKSQADDIFQEGLIQIYKDMHQFDHTKSAFTTWSSRVLVNAALKYLKKYNWIDTISEFEEASEIAQNGEEDIYQKMASKELTAMVQKLPLGYKLAFNMYVIEGYTHKEIAKALDISIGTSKSQLSKARKALRQQLESQLNYSGHE